MLHISIVLINYNAQKDTVACLKSLRECRTANFKYSIVVVDNGSRESFKLPVSLLAPHIEVIRSESNLGFTGGNNMGIYYCIEKFNSDYVLLLNNDTFVDPDFLKELVKQAESNQKIGLLSSKIYFAQESVYHSASYSKDELGHILWYAGGSIDWNHLAAFHRGVDEVDRGQFDTQSESDFATGCSMLIKREVLEKVGTFDRRFFLYMEDVDLSVRAKNAGYIIGFSPKSIVYHKNAGSSGGSGSKIHDYYQTRNRLLFAFKHGGWMQVITALRISLQLLLSGNSRQRQALFDFVTRQYGKQPNIYE